ncbi:MAG: DUF3800 domain-containing protein [Thermomicrobiales bacterium]
MYLDESGDHNLKRINSIYPVFVLGGVIVDRAYARNVIAPTLRQFKLDHFGRDDVILHTVEMAKGRGDYAFLADPTLRANFYSDLNTMLPDLDYIVVACVIKKSDHVAKYGANAADPYTYSLEVLVERFCLELGTEPDSGFICAEKRNPGLDRELMAAWEDLLTNGIGTGYVPSKTIDERIIGLDLKDKKPNIAGMQLADLVITPIGRYVVGMPPKINEIQWMVVESKLRRVWGRYQGRGLVILP